MRPAALNALASHGPQLRARHAMAEARDLGDSAAVSRWVGRLTQKTALVGEQGCVCGNWVMQARADSFQSR
jgi:hypothetical protein